MSREEFETWIDNMIIKDTFQKETIPFYHYSEFENVKLIDRNSYEATFKIFHKTISLKCVSLHDKLTLNNFINEVKRHRKLEIHDNVLRFYGITKQENTNNYMIILEHATNGTLRQYLITNFQKMNWNTKLNLAKQITNALMNLHSNEIIHGKLNSKNILVVQNENIKSNDFEMAKLASESLKLKFLTNILGPIDPQYSELFNITGKNKCSDIFSLGIILWEISSGKPPSEMDPSSIIGLLNNIVKGEREMIIPGTPSKYMEIYTDCWNHNRNLRPDISQVVENLSKIITSDVNVGFETSQSDSHNVTDKVISIELDKQSDDLEVKTDPSFIDVSAGINKSINDLFEFFIDLYNEQTSKMQPIMIKNYIRERNKNPVKLLYEMTRHPSYYWFTSLIGFFYMYGIGTIIDYKMAFEFFSLAASNKKTDMKNNSFANPSPRKLYEINKEIGFIYLANLYLDGQGVEKDMKKAFQICSKVADEGSLIALNKIAYSYGNGFGVEKNDETAFKLYLKSAEGGYLVAQYNVGYCYMNGKGILKDETKGFEWYMKSALAGNIWAMCNTGHCYDYGTGVDKDVKEAFKWYLIAAEKEYSLAQYNLGCYATDNGIVENQAKSFEWFKKAAVNGYTNAQYLVGKYFHEGHETKKDIIKAVHWLNKAHENGCTTSNSLLEEIINR